MTYSASVRRGITLMEVLIAMFVASVGLMGLAALIPVGGHNLREANKSDRANAVARAAYREIKARGWLRPEYLYGAAADGSPPNMTQPFCLDPLFVQLSANLGDARRWESPVRLDNDPIFADGSTPPPRMFRASLRQAPGSSTILTPIPFATADRLFRNEDDRTFELPNDNTKRARAVLGADNRLQSDGDFTWMATVVPAYQATSGLPSTYKVSVAVFYRRNLLIPAANKSNRTDGPPTERYLYADFLSGGIGWGGGDVRLRLVDSSATLSTSPENSDFPRIRPGQCIMLAALRSNNQPVIEWYRVVSTSRRADGQDGPELATSGTPSGESEWYTDVTLDGADWNPTERNPSTNVFAIPDMDRSDTANLTLQNGYMTVYAAVFEGVVGVYTKTIEVDSWATP
jgi:hypothetical protein